MEKIKYGIFLILLFAIGCNSNSKSDSKSSTNITKENDVSFDERDPLGWPVDEILSDREVVKRGGSYAAYPVNHGMRNIIYEEGTIIGFVDIFSSDITKDVIQEIKNHHEKNGIPMKFEEGKWSSDGSHDRSIILSENNQVKFLNIYALNFYAKFNLMQKQNSLVGPRQN